MSTFFQRFLALFSAPTEHPEADGERTAADGMPLAGPTYLRQFAQRLGLEVDDLSAAEQTELKKRLDESMDFREDNYGALYHEVYQLGHGYSLADAARVSGQINKLCADPAAQAYVDYRENAVAAEALMAAGSLLENEGNHAGAERLFGLADARRHRSSRLAAALENGTGQVDVAAASAGDSVAASAVAGPAVAGPAVEGPAVEGPAKEPQAGGSGLQAIMDGNKTAADADKTSSDSTQVMDTVKPKGKNSGK